MNVNTDTALGQYLVFSIHEENYAISILKVREIIEFRRITHVPSAPSCVSGVINLRGSVLPVIDLSVKFGLPAIEPTKQSCIVVVETAFDGQATPIGIMVDVVNQVVELGCGQIQQPPAFGTRVNFDFLLGLAELEEGFVLILDLDRMLTVEELLKSTGQIEPTAESAMQATQ